MILSVTMNPSVDISYPLDTLKLNTVNRSDQTKKTAGGKGLNVARVISLMGEQVIATGFLGGTIGLFIEEELAKNQIENAFYKIDQESRNCIAILHEGQQTEILEAGPILTKADAEQFLIKFSNLLNSADIVTISGSLPQGIDADIYQEMIRMGNSVDVVTILDCSGEALRFALESPEKPFLIKPNQEELGQLLGEEIPMDSATLKEVLHRPIFNGIPWIVVSMGADGGFVKCGEDFFQVEIPKINVVNPVGSGDATVAGLAVAIQQKKNASDILKTAMTTGILNTMQAGTGYIEMEKFQEYINQVKVTII